MFFDTGTLLLSGGIFISNMIKQDKLNQEADNRNRRALNRLCDASHKRQVEEQEMQNEVVRLINRKKGVLQTTMPMFIELYEKIGKIQFNESDGICQLSTFKTEYEEDLKISVDLVRSTPEKIPTITTNVILGGLYGGVLGAISSSCVDDAKRKVDLAKLEAKQIRICEIQENTAALSYSAIGDKTRMITTALTRLNQLFNRSIKAASEVIDKNGLDKSAYSQKEREVLATCINLAVVIKDIIDVPVITKEGQENRNVNELVKKAQTFLEEK